jgi:aquaporin Z
VTGFIGTFRLVLGGRGIAVLAAVFPGLGVGFAGVYLAFDLTVGTMAFTAIVKCVRNLHPGS